MSLIGGVVFGATGDETSFKWAIATGLKTTVVTTVWSNVRGIRTIKSPEEKGSGSFASPQAFSLQGDSLIEYGSDLLRLVVNKPTTPATWSVSGLTSGWTQREFSTGSPRLDNVGVFTKDGVLAGETGNTSVTYTGSSNAVEWFTSLIELIPYSPYPRVSKSVLMVKDGASSIEPGPTYRTSQSRSFYISSGIDSSLGSDTAKTLGGSTAYEQRNQVGGIAAWDNLSIGIGYSPVKAVGSKFLWIAAALGQAVGDNQEQNYATIDSTSAQSEENTIAYAIFEHAGIVPVGQAGTAEHTWEDGMTSQPYWIDPLHNFDFGDSVNSYRRSYVGAGSAHGDVGGMIVTPTLPPIDGRKGPITPMGVEVVGLAFVDSNSTTNVGLSLPSGYTSIGTANQSTASSKIAMIAGYKYITEFDNSAITFGLSNPGATNPGWVAVRARVLFRNVLGKSGGRFRKR